MTITPVNETLPSTHFEAPLESLPPEMLQECFAWLDTLNQQSASFGNRNLRANYIAQTKNEQIERIASTIVYLAGQCKNTESEKIKTCLDSYDSATTAINDSVYFSDVMKALDKFGKSLTPVLKSLGIQALQKFKENLNTPSLRFIKCIDSILMEFQPLLDAEESANVIPDPNEKSEALKRVSEAFQQAGNLPDAGRVAISIPDHLIRSTQLNLISQAFMKAGNLHEAEKMAVAIPIEGMKSLSLFRISTALAKAGNLIEAERFVHLIPRLQQKSMALVEIVFGYTKIGNFKEAERVAHSDPSTDGRSRRLRDIATMLVKQGNLIDAKRIALTIPDDLLKSQLLNSINLRK